MILIKKAFNQLKVKGLNFVPGAGIEPAQPQWPQDFKSCVSTNSTIRAQNEKKSVHKKKAECIRLYFFLSGKRDSNSRPQPWQGCALPTELFPQYFNYSVNSTYSPQLRMQKYCIYANEPKKTPFFLAFISKNTLCHC